MRAPNLQQGGGNQLHATTLPSWFGARGPCLTRVRPPTRVLPPRGGVPFDGLLRAFYIALGFAGPGQWRPDDHQIRPLAIGQPDRVFWRPLGRTISLRGLSGCQPSHPVRPPRAHCDHPEALVENAPDKPTNTQLPPRPAGSGDQPMAAAPGPAQGSGSRRRVPDRGILASEGGARSCSKDAGLPKFGFPLFTQLLLNVCNSLDDAERNGWTPSVQPGRKMRLCQAAGYPTRRLKTSVASQKWFEVVRFQVAVLYSCFVLLHVRRTPCMNTERFYFRKYSGYALMKRSRGEHTRMGWQGRFGRVKVGSWAAGLLKIGRTARCAGRVSNAACIKSPRQRHYFLLHPLGRPSKLRLVRSSQLLFTQEICIVCCNAHVYDAKSPGASRRER